MAWIIGIDEAGYGPNLGPFVMSAVGVRVADFSADVAPDLWQVLAGCVRKGKGRDDGRILIDDSKVVHSGPRALARLEAGVLAALTLAPDLAPLPATLAGLLARLAPDAGDDLARECWYTGAGAVPAHPGHPADRPERLRRACAEASIGPLVARSQVICPARFNRLCEAAGSKAAVSAYALSRLLEDWLELAPTEPLHLYIDKQGGRNCYAPQIQNGLPRGIVAPLCEGAEHSSYLVHGLGREVRLTFEPRAEDRHLSVALASMLSKYLRERCMGEFNAFWIGHLPELKPTAGYPVDAARFFEQITPVVERLDLPLASLWRNR